MNSKGVSGDRGRGIRTAWIKRKRRDTEGEARLAGGGGDGSDAAIVSGVKLAGASGWGAVVHGFRFRKHWEIEETIASPPMPFAWPGVRPLLVF